MSLTGLTAEVTSVQISIQFDASSTELRTQHLSQGIRSFSIIAFPAERNAKEDRPFAIRTGLAPVQEIATGWLR